MDYIFLICPPPLDDANILLTQSIAMLSDTSGMPPPRAQIAQTLRQHHVEALRTQQENTDEETTVSVAAHIRVIYGQLKVIDLNSMKRQIPCVMILTVKSEGKKPAF